MFRGVWLTLKVSIEFMESNNVMVVLLIRKLFNTLMVFNTQPPFSFSFSARSVAPKFLAFCHFGPNKIICPLAWSWVENENSAFRCKDARYYGFSITMSNNKFSFTLVDTHIVSLKRAVEKSRVALCKCIRDTQNNAEMLECLCGRVKLCFWGDYIVT